MVRKTAPLTHLISPPANAGEQLLVGRANSPQQPAQFCTEIIPLPADALVRRRRQRVTQLARACGDQSPNLLAQKQKQKEKSIDEVPAVTEITYKTGKQVWYFRYPDQNDIKLNGKRRKPRVKIGVVGEMSYMDRVALAKQFQDDVAAGRDPKASRMTFESFVGLYFSSWVTQSQRSSKDTLARLRHHVLPLLGNKALGDITHHDGERLIAWLSRGNASMRFGMINPATINRVLMAARSVFKLVVQLGFIPSNPFQRVRQLKECPPSPKALDQTELDRVMAALLNEPPIFALLIKLLLATAARVNEILALQEADIDEVNRVIHLRMTKAGEAQALPMTTTVVAILDALKPLRRPGNPHLFPAKTGSGHIVEPYKRLRKVLAMAGLEMAGFHLFRKTVATLAMQLPGMDVLTVSRLLRHKSTRTLEIHYLATPKKRVFQAANDIGEVLLGRREGGVS
ncbi:MAG: site-specific integrase [Proteobacteria bacterium]|nr:site-specific integrase [Pseudomonadota bacterium]